jgi:asparagine synthase (glutamine-hydrolysing)
MLFPAEGRSGMCGICGGLSWSRPVEPGELGAMLKTLVHRGPDGEGAHLRPPVALGARRLAVIDLETGSQPIANEDGSVRVVQNGEIYNYLELRAELEARGHRFATKSDTEVLVHLYEEHGEDFPRKLVGMFAVALWDREREKLVLVRDRFGEKPLYWARRGDGLVFASEMKALFAADPGLSRELDYGALGEYLGKLYVGGERTICRQVKQLPPATLMAVWRGGQRTTRYWQAADAVPRSGELREEALLDELEALLSASVRLRLRSDVPLGCFLSGGVDSSVLAALACELSGRVKTFSVGFARGDYDESANARAVAEHLGTEHHELRAEDAGGEVAARLPELFDQPFGDSSAVPSWQVARLARGEVTVALSGDGGDEVFGGYRRYLAARLAARYNRLPRAVRGGVSWMARLLGGGAGGYGGGLRENLRRFASFAEGVRARPGLTRPDYFDAAMQEELLRPEVWEQVRAAAASDDLEAPPAGLDPAEAAMRRDLAGYLPDDILVKVDRTSMDVALESRAPYLDHRVAEFMLSLPVEWKLRGRTGKYLLRRLAARLLPPEVAARKKHGFALPLAERFAPGGEDRKRLEALTAAGGPLESLVRPEAVKGLLDAQDAGRAALGEHLWALTALGAWAAGRSSG